MGGALAVGRGQCFPPQTTARGDLQLVCELVEHYLYDEIEEGEPTPTPAEECEHDNVRDVATQTTAADGKRPRDDRCLCEAKPPPAALKASGQCVGPWPL